MIQVGIDTEESLGGKRKVAFMLLHLRLPKTAWLVMVMAILGVFVLGRPAHCQDVSSETGVRPDEGAGTGEMAGGSGNTVTHGGNTMQPSLGGTGPILSAPLSGNTGHSSSSENDGGSSLSGSSRTAGTADGQAAQLANFLQQNRDADLAQLPALVKTGESPSP